MAGPTPEEAEAEALLFVEEQTAALENAREEGWPLDAVEAIISERDQVAEGLRRRGHGDAVEEAVRRGKASVFATGNPMTSPTYSVRWAGGAPEELWMNAKGKWGSEAKRAKYETQKKAIAAVEKFHGEDFQKYGLFPNSVSRRYNESADTKKKRAKVSKKAAKKKPRKKKGAKKRKPKYALDWEEHEGVPNVEIHSADVGPDVRVVVGRPRGGKWRVGYWNPARGFVFFDKDFDQFDRAKRAADEEGQEAMRMASELRVMRPRAANREVGDVVLAARQYQRAVEDRMAAMDRGTPEELSRTTKREREAKEALEDMTGANRELIGAIGGAAVGAALGGLVNPVAAAIGALAVGAIGSVVARPGLPEAPTPQEPRERGRDRDVLPFRRPTHPTGGRAANPELSVGDEVEFVEDVRFVLERDWVTVLAPARGTVTAVGRYVAVDVPSLNLPDSLRFEEYCHGLPGCTGNVVVFDSDADAGPDAFEDWPTLPPVVSSVPKVLQKVSSRPGQAWGVPRRPNRRRSRR